jgi:hypothetical protein
MVNRLAICSRCTEELPPWEWSRICLSCRYGSPALATVRQAKGFRRQEAAYLSDEELAYAVEWYWADNPPPADKNVIYWTRPKLAQIARAWMREYQPHHLTLLNRARQAANRARQRTRKNGGSEDEAAYQYGLAFDAAVRRAIEEDTWASPALDRYRLAGGTRMASKVTLDQLNDGKATQAKGGAVIIIYVEPGDAHRFEECPDLGACRWHGRPRPVFADESATDQAIAA